MSLLAAVVVAAAAVVVASAPAAAVVVSAAAAAVVVAAAAVVVAAADAAVVVLAAAAVVVALLLEEADRSTSLRPDTTLKKYYHDPFKIAKNSPTLAVHACCYFCIGCTGSKFLPFFDKTKNNLPIQDQELLSDSTYLLDHKLVP